MKNDNHDSSEKLNEIIFAGRSNVGKSSIIRIITGKKVKVGKRPGVTLKPTSIQYPDFLITDMPGFGFMSGVKERKQDIVKDKIIKYIETNTSRIKLAVLVVDGSSFNEIVERWNSRGQIPIDIEMFDFLNEISIPVIIAINKADKIDPDRMDDVIDDIVEKFGLLPPWRQWIDQVAVISAKKNAIEPLTKLIRNRLQACGRNDLIKHLRY
ncbi:GTP-binding protein EngB [Methanosalsum zhilinae]|uniref:GTP-binding protein EngB n=1 Tax=Methanosalsum zhilinae TaxID=39669 RepID=UPI001FE0E2B8|nr:GTP-binding protein EngB [Methanosalsum zhilinae]